MSRARQRIFSVAEGDPATLGELLGTIGEGPALAEGRVFVDGRRAGSGEVALARGARVEVFAERPSGEPVRVLAERGDLVAVAKPAAMATEPDRQGAHGSLVHAAARLLGTEAAELHALSRLDVGVSGVVLLARGTERPTRLDKLYVGIALSEPKRAGSWDAPIRVRGRELAAETRASVVARTPSGATLLRLVPITGRTHQLRIHAANAGAPLAGDRAHGGAARIVLPSGSVIGLERVLLHSLAIRVESAGGERWEAVASPPEALLEAWRALGGSAGDFDAALCWDGAA